MAVEFVFPLSFLAISHPEFQQLLQLARLGGFCPDDWPEEKLPRRLSGSVDDREGILAMPPAEWWQHLAESIEQIVPDLSPESRCDGTGNVLEKFGGPHGIQFVSALPAAFRQRDVMIRLK